MKTVGKQLQEARIAKEWSPELAARETKIKVERLHELESDDYSNFSSPTYARGFVRTYARALGIDEYKILRQLDNKLPEDDNATFVNDTGVPYMPEPSQVSSGYKVGPGVYVAMGVGATVLFLIAFILFQSYRVGYFAKAVPLPPAPTNAVPVVTEAEPVARALPADSNAAPVALPVDIQPVPAVATAAPATTNQPPVAVAVAPAATNGATNSVTNVAVTTNAPAAEPVTTPLDTKTPPRALPVDLNALTAASPDTSTNAAPATTSPATTPFATTSTNAAPATTSSPSASTNAPSAAVAATPVVPAPAPRPPPSLSARGSNARPEPLPKPHADAYTPVPLPIVPAVPAAPRPAAAEPAALASTAPAETAPETAPLTGEQPAPSIASDTMSAPATTASPESANTGAPAAFTDSSSPVRTTSNLDKAAGKRLVLTASHDSYIRVVSLDSGQQVRYSSILHQGQSISFSDRKYSINIGVPSAVNIALDGINYGPHSDHAQPDTFTVESHQP